MGIKGGPAIEISDEEESKMDVASAKISGGLQQMMGSLTHLKETADKMVEERQTAVKRPRLGNAVASEEEIQCRFGVLDSFHL